MRYLILGATQARDARGADIPLGGARLRALAAALALRPGRPVPVGLLVDEVWGAEPPQDAANALQALVSRLRRALGRDAVSSGPGGYLLHAEPDDVDLHRFERLTDEGGQALAAGDPARALRLLDDALALWRGPALADLPERASAGARPEALRLTALHRRADAALALGRAAEILPQLQELVADHPLHEPFRVQLIRALRADGRGAAALAAYEEARRLLADRLGTDPGPELRALHRELLAPEPLEAPAPRGPARATPPGSARPGAHPAAPSTPTTPAAPPTPLPPRRGNLRARLTSFVGREAELAALEAELRQARLVTLAGPGGSGKTRLAQELADALSPRFADGAWFAELAPLDEQSAVPGAVLNAVGARSLLQYATTADLRLQEADPTTRLIEHCANRRLLLVVDNCEHVIRGAAGLLDTLLATCPGVTVLATSREPLGIPGETVRPVEPLPQRTARRLFTERATAVRPGFDPDQDPAAVAEICRRLDGLPLAIELAAARLRLLTPRQIADRLDDRFRLLTSGHRTALPRQQTLRAVVDWSWDLLNEAERTLLRRLSVFSGGWTLASAESVCAHAGIAREDVLDLLGSLVDKSLLIADQPAEVPEDGVRYRMLETIHEYAADRAAEDERDRTATALRHTGHFRLLVRTADPLLRGRGQLRWIARLEKEMDNVRAALRRSLDTGDEASALAIGVDLTWFWTLRNYREEAVAWLSEAVALGDPALLPGPADPQREHPLTGPLFDEDHPLYWPRMDALLALVFLGHELPAEVGRRGVPLRALGRRLKAVYHRPGPYAARMPGLIWPITGFLMGEQADIGAMCDWLVDNCREHGGTWEMAMALMMRSLILTDQPDGLRQSELDLAEAEPLLEEVGDLWGRAQLLGGRADIAAARGDYASAAADLEESLRLGGELGMGHERAFVIGRLADVAFRDGDVAQAEKLARQAEESATEHGVADARSFCRFLLAHIALHQGEPDRARRMLDLGLSEVDLGTPPPMFLAVGHGLSGRLGVSEGRPAEGLRECAEALREAVRGQCDERVLSTLLEWSAAVACALDRMELAARLLGAATQMRAGLPRSMAEREEAERIRATAEPALGPPAYARALAEGAALDRRAALALLDTELATLGTP